MVSITERNQMDQRFLHFDEELKKIKIELSEHQFEQFMTYYELLVEKNKVMNLTAITEFDDVIEKHFLDSLNLVRVMDLTKPISMMDMGTGAGFPGIPLKIAFPNLEMTLADSLNKRVLFLQEVVDKLQLSGVNCIHGRAEDLAKNPDYREKYDLVVSRAVANLSTLSEYCLPFAKIGGSFVSYKSGNCQEEVDRADHAIKILGGKRTDTFTFELGDAGRSFILIEKIRHTGKQYPRKAGLPSKSPL